MVSAKTSVSIRTSRKHRFLNQVYNLCPLIVHRKIIGVIEILNKLDEKKTDFREKNGSDSH